MNKQEFIDRLFQSHGVIVDWDGKEHIVSDLMNRANNEKHDKVVLTQQDRPEEYFVEYMSAVLGGGTLVRSTTKPKTKPVGDYVSFTSGSTGEPKPIAHTIENFIAPALALVNQHNFTDRSVWLNYAPCTTNVIFSIALLPTAFVGGKIVLKKFNPFHLAEEINSNMPTHTTIMPAMYTAVRGTKNWDSCDMSSLEFVLTGGNSSIPGYFDAIANRGGKPFHGFGTTEMPGNMVANPDSETHLGHIWYPGAEWKSVDGELWVRWNHMDWFQTGDMIEVDPVLGPRITGRKDNQFKYRDFRIIPESYELIAKEHSQVNEAMLRLEDHLVLYYEGDAEPADLESLLLKYNTKETMPRRIIKVKALPRVQLGKLARQGEIVV